MKRTTITIFAKVALVAGLVAGPASADGTEVFSARLLGDNEVPPINSTGTATFHMEIKGTDITFSLKFSGLSSNLLVSHLHFAPTKVAGGVMIFLCGGGNQPACPAATSGTISGTIAAANVTGPTGQGIAPGDLTSALEAVREGNAYANMHTDNFKGGEIRGQVRRGDRGERSDR
jgi:CHRD domain